MKLIQLTQNSFEPTSEREFKLILKYLIVIFVTFVSSIGWSQHLVSGNDFQYLDCRAHLSENQLTISNAHVRRRWTIEQGKLFATSFFDIDRGLEWIDSPSNLPSPAPPGPVEKGQVEMTGATGTFGPTEAKSLRIELQVTGVQSKVTYVFQIFPEASGIRIYLSQQGAIAKSEGSKVENRDAIEHLQTGRQHLKFTQVTLRDRTDSHNELVFESEWLLQPNEALLQLQGDVFFLEDTLTGSGLVFLKEAPLSDMQSVHRGFDAQMKGSKTALSKTSDKGHNTFDISFYGQGFEGEGQGYASALIAYHGGRSGRIAALQQYQKQIRVYQSGRDGQLLSNTWGDRSGGAKLNEAFIKREIDAGRDLGIDIVQVDDGWEIGKTVANKGPGGVWEGYRAHQPDFWAVSPERFPKGLGPVIQYAHKRGMKLGLWFGPDSSNDFQDWKLDADLLLNWNREDHVAAFKLDSVKLRSKVAEINYHKLLDRVLAKSEGRILLDLDVTAETRQGYFGNIAAGPLFVENRYTDWHRYWPHQTLRNLWKLAQYVDPVRMRIEFLNSERNTAFYDNDPLAPANYRSSYLFATTMFASPLGWFEATSLSPRYISDAKPIIAAWKKERDAMYTGTTIPIGEVPDGTNWTGFESVAQDRNSGYLLVFRELNGDATWTAPQSLFAKGAYRLQVLGGEGTATQSDRGFEVDIPHSLGFLWVKLIPVK